MLSDPFNITYNSVVTPMSCVTRTSTDSVYRSSNGELELTISKGGSNSVHHETVARLSRVTSDTDWANGSSPDLRTGEIIGVLRNNVNVGESERALLRTCISSFLAANSVRLLAGEY